MNLTRKRKLNRSVDMTGKIYVLLCSIKRYLFYKLFALWYNKNISITYKSRSIRNSYSYLSICITKNKMKLSQNFFPNFLLLTNNAQVGIIDIDIGLISQEMRWYISWHSRLQIDFFLCDTYRIIYCTFQTW